MDDPDLSSPRARMLIRSSQTNRFKAQVLAEAYQQACPGIRRQTRVSPGARGTAVSENGIHRAATAAGA